MIGSRRSTPVEGGRPLQLPEVAETWGLFDQVREASRHLCVEFGEDWRIQWGVIRIRIPNTSSRVFFD